MKPPFYYITSKARLHRGGGFLDHIILKIKIFNLELCNLDIYISINLVPGIFARPSKTRWIKFGSAEQKAWIRGWIYMI